MLGDWIKENILNKGIDNVRFFAKMGKIEAVLPWGMAMVSGNKDTWVECIVTEKWYKVADGYKITLQSLDNNYTYEHYYQEDFESLVEEGRIILKRNEKDHIEHIRCAELLYGDVYLIHEGDMVVQ